MFQRAIFTTSTVLLLLCSCAGPNADTTTTTSGTVESHPTGPCRSYNAPCSTDGDCCSQWCTAGRCDHRQP